MTTHLLIIKVTIVNNSIKNNNRRNVATLAPRLHMEAVEAAAAVTDLLLLIPLVMVPVRVAQLRSPSKRPTKLRLLKMPKLLLLLKPPSKHQLNLQTRPHKPLSKRRRL